MANPGREEEEDRAEETRIDRSSGKRVESLLKADRNDDRAEDESHIERVGREHQQANVERNAELGIDSRIGSRFPGGADVEHLDEKHHRHVEHGDGNAAQGEKGVAEPPTDQEQRGDESIDPETDVAGRPNLDPVKNRDGDRGEEETAHPSESEQIESFRIGDALFSKSFRKMI